MSSTDTSKPPSRPPVQPLPARAAQHASLTEYRCTCGKLLFKGVLLLSVIETKCRRCGVVKTFRGENGCTIRFASLSDLLPQLRGMQANSAGCIVFTRDVIIRTEDEPRSDTTE